jgi:excisionase family DNA binding protein
MSYEPAMQTPPLAVRVPEACRLSGIGRSKLYELIKAGELRTIKVGAITLIPLTSLERLLGLADR